MIFQTGRIDIAVEIMQEATAWLIETGKPLWNLEDLAIDKMLKTECKESFVVGLDDEESVAAMILKWHDPLFWPEISPNKSGFIHKLCVRRKYAGKGIAQKMIDYAIKECKTRTIKCLRLDCDADRIKLISLYKSLGFSKTAQRKMDEYTVALFELYF